MMRSMLAVGAGVAVLAVAVGLAFLALALLAPDGAGALAGKVVAALAGSLVAGVFTAKAAGRRPVLHGAVLAGLVGLLGLPGLLSGQFRDDPAWQSTGAVVAAAPAAVLGAWLGRKRGAASP